MREHLRIERYYFLLLIFILEACQQPTDSPDYDVIVYGATPAGIMSAVTAADHGAKVLLIEPMRVVGGMVTSGLMTAESEHMINQCITGRARDFYVRLGELHYDSAYFQTFGTGRKLNFQPGDPALYYESKHAQALFEQMIVEAGVELISGTHLTNASTTDKRIQQISLSNGQQYAGAYFADCSYEGDLMAEAGVSYTFGREPVSKYQESLAGVRLIDDTLSARTVDEQGDLLPYFNRYDTLIPGSGDDRVMNYNFRPIMTKVDSNKVAIDRPANYHSTQFNFLADYLKSRPETTIYQLIGVYRRGNQKYEFNNQQKSLVSLGMFGANQGYTDGDWETRQRIYQAHKDWTLGFLYFLTTDPRVPEKLAAQTREYGYAADEFVDNDHFPYYLYVREGRRMLGPEVHTQHDVFGERQKDESILLGSHWVDSHHVQRIALSDSTFTNEGRIWEITLLPFEISYRVITPKKEECENLLVPVCASFSHVAFCAYRLESTWMQAGHAAGLALSLALQEAVPVQDIDVGLLQKTLQEEGMIIEADSIREYDDYDWLKGNQRYGDRYKRMYDAYEVDVSSL
jgi:hypothetical protein